MEYNDKTRRLTVDRDRQENSRTIYEPPHANVYYFSQEKMMNMSPIGNTGQLGPDTGEDGDDWN